MAGAGGGEEKEGTERGAEPPKIGVCFPLQPCGKLCCCLSPQQPGRAGVGMAGQDRGWWHLRGPVALLTGRERDALPAPWGGSGAGTSLGHPFSQPFGEGWGRCGTGAGWFGPRCHRALP